MTEILSDRPVEPIQEWWVCKCYICQDEWEFPINIDPRYSQYESGRILAPFPKHRDDGGIYLPLRPVVFEIPKISLKEEQKLNCLNCGMPLKLDGIQEDSATHKGYDNADRSCPFCVHKFAIRVKDGNLLAVVHEEHHDEGLTMGYDYKCHYCNHEGKVYTNFHPPETGWKCLNCGSVLVTGTVFPFGGYSLEKSFYTGDVIPMTSLQRDRKRHRSSSGTSTTKTSSSGTDFGGSHSTKTIAAGMIPLATLCQEMGWEGRKLRQWLRKTNFRSADEHGSGWQFTTEQIAEIKAKFKG